MRVVSCLSAALIGAAFVAGCGTSIDDDAAGASSGAGAGGAEATGSSSSYVPPPPPGTGGSNGAACGWAKRFGDASEQNGFTVAVAPSGDIAVGGVYAGALDFGAGPLAENTSGGLDLFVARFTSDGSLVYGRSIASTDAEQILVASAPNGDTYVFGALTDFADLGGGARVDATTAQYDAFLARLDAAGDVVFVERIPDANGAPIDRQPGGLAVAPSGDVFLWGLETTGDDDFHVYVDRLTADGAVVWSRTASLVDDVLLLTPGFGTAVALPSGGVAISFTYAADLGDSSVDFGDGVSADVAAGHSAAFVTAFDDAGTPLFTHAFSDATNADGPIGYGLGIAVDAAGTLFGVGYYDGTVDIGTGPMTGAPTATFVAALGADGAPTRATNLPGAAIGVVATGPDGRVFVAGMCEGTCDLAGTHVDASEGDPLIVAEIDGAGAVVKGAAFGPGDAGAAAMAIDATGAVVIAGEVDGSVDICGADLFSEGDVDVLVARFPAIPTGD
ncbi:MAG TPA: hypothetical protein VGM56_15330 [Byssovorax sp.]|jgi:hypothetical protein